MNGPRPAAAPVQLATPKTVRTSAGTIFIAAEQDEEGVVWIVLRWGPGSPVLLKLRPSAASELSAALATAVHHTGVHR